MTAPGETPANTYKCFYLGKSPIIERAPTSYAAQLQAAKRFRAKKSFQVHVVLLAKGDEEVLVSPASL